MRAFTIADRTPSNYRFTVREYFLLDLAIQMYYEKDRDKVEVFPEVPRLYRRAAYRLVRKGLAAFANKKLYPTELFFEVFVNPQEQQVEALKSHARPVSSKLIFTIYLNEEC